MQFSVQEKCVTQFIICSSTCNVANTSVHVSAVFATKSIQLYNYISFLRIYHTTRSKKIITENTVCRHDRVIDIVYYQEPCDL